MHSRSHKLSLKISLFFERRMHAFRKIKSRIIASHDSTGDSESAGKQVVVPTPLSPSSRLRRTINQHIRARKLVLEAEFEVGLPNMRMQSTDVITASAFMRAYSAQGDFIIRVLEDLGILIYHLIHANTKIQYTIAIVNYLKHVTGKPVLGMSELANFMEYFDSLFSIEIQSADTVFVSLRNYLDKYDEVKQSPLFQKLYRFIMYCMCNSVFSKVGLSFDKFQYTKLEQEALRKQYHMGPDFVHSILDTLLFLSERGYQCIKLGSMQPIYHSGSRYEQWFDTASELKRDSNYLTNPEPHGIDRFSYLAKLNDAIEKGSNIHKHVIGDYEKRLVKRILSDLEMIKGDELTKRAAQRNRKAPFSVLLYGGSSVAKSTFTDMLFYHYGKIFNLSTDAEFKYTRNPADPYWVNFNSTKWCVQLDDIAYLHPNATSSGDPSLMEMLQVINNVPFVPTQADLADKGRTPMNSRFVIATTNTQHLNAYAYFSCPLAVQRRLPWIIDITPKTEFTKDGCMIDGNLVPEIHPGDYPNFWNITLKRVVPHGTDRNSQKADIVEVQKFTHIHDFLQWFSTTAKAYDDLENKVEKSNQNMKLVAVCKDCYVPVLSCRCLSTDSGRLELQSDDILGFYHPHIENDFSTNFTRCFEVNRNKALKLLYDKDSIKDLHAATEDLGIFFRIYMYYVLFCIWLYVTFPWVRVPYNFCFGTLSPPNHFSNYSQTPHFWRISMRYMGYRVQRKIGTAKALLIVSATLLASASVYKLLGKFIREILLGPSNDVIKKTTVAIPAPSLQGNDISTELKSSECGNPPTTPVDEKPNIWFKDNYQTTSFDVSPQTTSYNSLEPEEIEDMLLRNCVNFKSHHTVGQLNANRPNKAICVTGHIYMTNNHGLPDCPKFRLEITQETATSGVTPNISVLMTQNDVQRFPQYDLAFVRLRNIPPRKNITNLFCKDSFEGRSKGVYLSRLDDGTTHKRVVHNIGKVKSFPIPEISIRLDTWLGKVRDPTVNGDCGAMLLAHSPRGPVILGMHMFGTPDGTVGSICVTASMVEAGLASFGTIHIQGAHPILSAPTAPRSLSDLHWKSPVRYIEKGAANVYGSFTGFRPGTKSSVVPTYISESAVEHGYQIKCGKPIMIGWEPWRIALMDMVKPVTEMDNSILDKCVDGYFTDIEHILTIDNLSQIHVYDNFTALNGAPGVAYIDKINRNTSAGNPWKKCKKFFLKPLSPIHGCDDPVEADEEIMDRVDQCIQSYYDGKRYCPNFCAHLKDEPVSFEKILAKKTRVFTGAPFEYTIVVRKFLLSLVRLIQKNKIVFETAVGTVCQSPEWGHIRKHLVKFGDSNMVAGDYKAYDKKMPPALVLASFEILRRICERAGYTDKEMTVIAGITEDTAFPLVDFNGDLIMFYGTNPSGHPLTVIINSIANSLYMRYCYLVLSPDKSCSNFVENVALMTYGDDNCMGVSRNCPWFNHTSIQAVLAEIGVTYTMAEKSAKSVPYISMSDISFLKRVWRWDSDVNAYLCPLDHSSIDKMLTMCVRSRTISMEEHSIQVIGTAIREYFFYGKVIFEAKRVVFQQIIADNFLDLYQQDNTLPTWQQLYDEFWT